MKRWQTKAVKAALAGRSPDVPFDPDWLSEDEAMQIRADLKRARTAEEVAAVFKRADRVTKDDLEELLGEWKTGARARIKKLRKG